MSSQSSPTPGQTPPGAAVSAATPSGTTNDGSIIINERSTTSITRTHAPLVDRMVGQVVGNCRLLRRLGRGGMGDVYLALHLEYHKSVAVKILAPDVTRNDELLARFRREAEAAARIDHPNIVEVYDIGCDRGHHYIVMGFVDGKSLQDIIDERKIMDPREAARVCFEIARGLQAVHADGIIHRDIKPANILITRKNEIKIVDFGLAFDAEDKSGLTVTGSIMGTPWYLSPEQADGKRADTRSDLYSLGITLYILATGERPFTGETHMSVLYKQIHEKARDPRLVNPDVPVEIVEIILRAMEKKPERRFQTADEFASELNRYLKGTYVRRQGAGAISDPVRRRRRKSAMMTAVFASWILALLGAILGAFVVSPKDAATSLAAAPAEVDACRPGALDPALLTEDDIRRLETRDYAPVISRLLDRHSTAMGAEKAALSKAGLRLSSAFKVVTRFRERLLHEKDPLLLLRDGRTSRSAATPIPSIRAESIVEIAAKAKDVADADLAWFLILEGEGLRALDFVIGGGGPQLDDLAEAALAQPRNAREIATRLAAVREKLGPSNLAKLDSALRR
jgi:tRNA A-37 threonylcarbamoyl transferase component Bud32